MSVSNPSKINQLLASIPTGVVLASSWLSKQGYSPGLQKRYRLSGWLESIGDGAMIRTGDKVQYEGALYALQTQLGLDVHIGGRTALARIGRAQYPELSQKRVILFSHHTKTLPHWFLKYDWGLDFDFNRSAFMPPELGLVDVETGPVSIKVSGAARAIMECLYLTPQKQELFECYELMEGLNDLRPHLVQRLLEECNSVKVKRLFMYLADKAGHPWVKHIDTSKIDFGKGKRALVKQGVYIPKYQITISEELERHDRSL